MGPTDEPTSRGWRLQAVVGVGLVIPAASRLTTDRSTLPSWADWLLLVAGAGITLQAAVRAVRGRRCDRSTHGA